MGAISFNTDHSTASVDNNDLNVNENISNDNDDNEDDGNNDDNHNEQPEPPLYEATARMLFKLQIQKLKLRSNFFPKP